jgi:transposase
VKIVITPGQTHDIQAAAELLADIRQGQMVLADRAYDADWLRAMLTNGDGVPTARRNPTAKARSASRPRSASSAA